MKKLLVIGGTGFFGKSILDAFGRGLLKPWGVSKVIVMSRNAQSLLSEAPQLVSDSVELYSADITSVESLPEADYVIHAAASTDLRDYLSKPEQEKKNIQAGTFNYCELAKKNHSKSKIVYVSSGAVYGVQPSSLNNVTESYVSNEMRNMAPGKLDYAIAKQDAEAAIRDLGALGLQVSIARCFAFVGPWLPRDQHFAIGNFIGDVISHKVIKVNATYKVYRSYMYADDLVEWLLTIADHASSKCPTYNVGSDESVALQDLAEMLAIQYKTKADVTEITDPKVDRYVPDIARAKNELGLMLKFSLLESVQETLNLIDKSHTETRH